MTMNISPQQLRAFFFLPLLLWGLLLWGQSPAPQQKEISPQSHFWTSINSTMRFHPRWGMMADAHIRRTQFMADPSFYFVRLGLNYWASDQLLLTAGWGHLWSAQAGNPPDKFVFADENRIYQQAQYASKWGKVSVLNRLRNEQRWQEKIAGGVPTGQFRFTNRIRYLLSFTLPVFAHPKYPSLVLADEILMHMGKEVVYNAMDQNRIFLGIRQKINKDLAFDFGYMQVFQQKYTGYQYDRNHTLRLFFYYSPNFSKSKSSHAALFSAGEE